MTDVVEVIRALTVATEGSRVLDRQVAEAVGWRREVKIDTDDNGNPITRGVWFPPDNLKSGTIPEYTSDLDAAQRLVNLVAPESTGGIGWEEGRASARIKNAPSVQAHTPALALCSAALRILHFKQLAVVT